MCDPEVSGEFGMEGWKQKYIADDDDGDSRNKFVVAGPIFHHPHCIAKDVQQETHSKAGSFRSVSF